MKDKLSDDNSRYFLISVVIFGSNLPSDDISSTIGLQADKQAKDQSCWVSETFESTSKEGVEALFEQILAKMKPNRSKIVNLLTMKGVHGRVCLSLNVSPLHGWEEISIRHLKELTELNLSLCLGAC